MGLVKKKRIKKNFKLVAICKRVINVETLSFLGKCYILMVSFKPALLILPHTTPWPKPLPTFHTMDRSECTIIIIVIFMVAIPIRDLKHQDGRGGRGRSLDEERWVHLPIVNMTHLLLSNREPTGGERREIRMSSLKTMTTFRDVQIALLDSYMDGEIDDDEFLVLWQVYQSKNPDFPYEDYGQFSLDEMDETECRAEFRFAKTDLPLLVHALGIPDQFTCAQRTVCDGMEGLCMASRRMAYPCRYSDLISRFGRPVPVISMICNRVVDFLFNFHVQCITRWNPQLLDPASLQMYCDAIFRKGAPLDNCFGFIDGTVLLVPKWD